MQSFMHNLSANLSANNVEFPSVILDELHNTAVLVCEIKFDFYAPICVNVNRFDQFDKQAARKGFNIAVL